MALPPRDLDRLARAFASASPFPHLVLPAFVDPERAARAAAVFPKADASWIRFVHWNERKYGNSRVETFPPELRALVEELSGAEFLARLSRVTGIAGLCADPDLCGGGLHQTPRGGFLNIHSDFGTHPRRRQWRRRVNLVLFLNDAWDEAYGGALELWEGDMSRCVVRVTPRLNTCVIFRTGRDSCHGHPEPLDCPPGRTRNSLALYYFTEEPSPEPARSTVYRPRPGDGVRGLAIHAENAALRIFDRLRGAGVVSDEGASRWLRLFERRAWPGR
ncbi:MAG: 2OG-Fe(II) oxygenase [bacterium]